MSKWIAERIRQGALSELPESVRELAGASTCPRPSSCASCATGMRSGRGWDLFVLDTNMVLDYFRGRGRLAERLLADSSAKVATVAHDVGYESEAAFSRAFKRFVGVSQPQWRQEAGKPF